jgi:hypothetical protein
MSVLFAGSDSVFQAKRIEFVSENHNAGSATAFLAATLFNQGHFVQERPFFLALRYSPAQTDVRIVPCNSTAYP